MQGLTKTCQSRVELDKIVESLPASYRVLRNECDISVQVPIEKCVDDIRVVVKKYWPHFSKGPAAEIGPFFRAPLER